MKNRVPSKPDWPPIIGTGITPFVRLRDTILTVIAWIFVGALLWELFEVLWDYFDEPIFAFSKTHSLSWLGLLNRIGNFALVSLLLVLWLTFWGFVRRKELRRTHDPRPVPALLLSGTCRRFRNSSGKNRALAAESDRGGSIRLRRSHRKRHR